MQSCQWQGALILSCFCFGITSHLSEQAPLLELYSVRDVSVSSFKVPKRKKGCRNTQTWKTMLFLPSKREMITILSLNKPLEAEGTFQRGSDCTFFWWISDGPQCSDWSIAMISEVIPSARPRSLPSWDGWDACAMYGVVHGFDRSP